MPGAIIEKLVPELIPRLDKNERDNMMIYYAYYEKHKDAIREELLDELSLHPLWGPLLKSIPKEIQEEENRISEELQKKAIYENEWEPYITSLIWQGIRYANMGVTFRQWFEIVNMLQKK